MSEILIIHPDNVKDIPKEYQHLERKIMSWAPKNITNEDGSESPGFWVINDEHFGNGVRQKDEPQALEEII